MSETPNQPMKIIAPSKTFTVKPIAPVQKLHSAREGIPAVSLDEWGDDLFGDDGELLKSEEWQIIYGDFRSGKTYFYLSELQAAHQINNDTRAFIFSTDQALKRNLEEFPYITATGFIKVVWCDSVEKMMLKTAQLIGSPNLIRPGIDWIVVDLASSIWQKMPDYWARMALGKSCDDILLQAQQAGNENSGNLMISYYKDHINPTWAKWEQKIRDTGCHVILVAGEQPLSEEDVRNPKNGKVIKKGDKESIVQLYRGVGVLPAIQKATPFQYHSILYLSQPYDRRFFLQTVGERGEREWFVPKKEITGKNFGETYLLEVAGWNKK